MVGRTLARARWLLHRLVHPDRDQAIRVMSKDMRRLAASLEQLRVAQENTATLVRRLDRASAQLKLVSALNLRQQDETARLPELLDDSRISAHVRRAVASATLLTDPYEHMVVDQVLPADVYDLLIRALPPVAFFNQRDPIKQNLVFPMDIGPTLSVRVWEYMDRVIARQMIRPAVLEKFREPLERHFESMFGAALAERARAVPQSVHGGRLMLRRPGYSLGPHRDPKHAMLTCLMYLARTGDSEGHGTQIFKVHGDGEAGYKQTYYPEQDGRRCELVKVVPFRANTMLVSLNSRGAHGAMIPMDAPADLERYAYQFYVAPRSEPWSALIKSLPREQRAMWKSKVAIG